MLKAKVAEGAGKDKGEAGSQQNLDRIGKGAWKRGLGEGEGAGEERDRLGRKRS